MFQSAHAPHLCILPCKSMRHSSFLFRNTDNNVAQVPLVSSCPIWVLDRGPLPGPTPDDRPPSSLAVVTDCSAGPSGVPADRSNRRSSHLPLSAQPPRGVRLDGTGQVRARAYAPFHLLVAYWPCIDIASSRPTKTCTVGSSLPSVSVSTRRPRRSETLHRRRCPPCPQSCLEHTTTSRVRPGLPMAVLRQRKRSRFVNPL